MCPHGQSQTLTLSSCLLWPKPVHAAHNQHNSTSCSKKERRPSGNLFHLKHQKPGQSMISFLGPLEEGPAACWAVSRAAFHHRLLPKHCCSHAQLAQHQGTQQHFSLAAAASTAWARQCLGEARQGLVPGCDDQCCHSLAKTLQVHQQSPVEIHHCVGAQGHLVEEKNSQFFLPKAHYPRVISSSS